MDGLKDGEKIDVAFPVTFRPNQPLQYQAFDWQLIKEVRKAVVQNGLQSPFSQMLLENVLCGQLVTPYDCQQLASLILTPAQKLLWKDKFVEYCEIKAVENLGRQQGDPLLGVGMDHYTGAGRFADPELQSRILSEVLRESAWMALRAFLTLPEASKQPISFTSIKRGVSETYMSFIDRLCDAVEKQIEHLETRESLLLKLALENENADCKKILIALPRNATLVEMVEAANRVGTLQQQATLLVGTFAAAMKPLESRRCYTCGQQGHLSYQCNKGQGRWQSRPQRG